MDRTPFAFPTYFTVFSGCLSIHIKHLIFQRGNYMFQLPVKYHFAVVWLNDTFKCTETPEEHIFQYQLSSHFLNEPCSSQLKRCVSGSPSEYIVLHLSYFLDDLECFRTGKMYARLDTTKERRPIEVHMAFVIYIKYSLLTLHGLQLLLKWRCGTGKMPLLTSYPQRK